MPNLLSGDFSSAGALVGRMSGIEAKKVSNFCEYMKLYEKPSLQCRRQVHGISQLLAVHLSYPEYSFIWMGDNGQADAEVGREMLCRFPNKIAAVFIHAVAPVSAERREVMPQSREPEMVASHTIELSLSLSQLDAKDRLFYCDTYIHAAIHAYELGLMPLEGMARVAEAALNDLLRLTFPISKDYVLVRFKQVMQRGLSCTFAHSHPLSPAAMTMMT